MKKLVSAATLTFLLWMLPLGVHAAELLIPVGRIIGVQLKTNTVTVAAFDDRLGKAARSAGLRIGDEIVSVNGQPISEPEDIRTALSHSSGAVQVSVRRGTKNSTLELTPQSTDDGPKLGVFLRQGITGIGTVTFYDPDSGCFGALGHGVNTAKGNLLPMSSGSAYPAQIVSVAKGKIGHPGQLKGSSSADDPWGTLEQNTPQGLFGKTNRCWSGQAIPAAQWEQLTTGSAIIRSTISGKTPKDYSVEIVKVYPGSRPDGRNMLIHVTDPELLNTTGGIVQGMSGSPIIQNGRLVGAVTHVLVNDPTMGYGIFIQNMLDAAA